MYKRQTYLKYVAPEDILVYSIDEVFIDVTDYLRTCGMSAHEMAMTMVRDVLYNTGITATAGIGTNLYLAKIAMDIVAKKATPDKDGVRIAELDEMKYRELLWTHRPLTDFWLSLIHIWFILSVQSPDLSPENPHHPHRPARRTRLQRARGHSAARHRTRTGYSAGRRQCRDSRWC